MLSSKVIEPIHRPWASPVGLVQKKDGTWRFCVEYCRLNTITRKDAYPLPRMDDVLELLHGFSTLDLASGYWQVTVAHETGTRQPFAQTMGCSACVK